MANKQTKQLRMAVRKLIIKCVMDIEQATKCVCCGKDIQKYYRKPDQDITYARCPECLKIYEIEEKQCPNLT